MLTSQDHIHREGVENVIRLPSKLFYTLQGDIEQVTQ